ncbi:uncharacterized protein BYT42DRAFT_611967 [Radiomyces spectabilis]|uniref:uncharacterized protein n=1 Tax=Radiomyces spectabilis TaxID=64574 RepID=UPI0022208724|nr:uncharacterized protein BYT42DRAFT_611967 [Radiomyces spectabilis]KAI8384249.1 hypothetical protein BYT42DRAFT_611967 [Radiomyces spectabilis]
MVANNTTNPYTNAFLTKRPKDGIEIVQERLRQSIMLDEELSQYFRERALIEDQYAKSLVKASKRLFVTDKSSLGNFTPIWECLFNEFTEISTAHAILAHQIAEEIEKPLKTSASPAHEKIKELEPGFARLAKDSEGAKKNKTLFKRSKSHSDTSFPTWQVDGPNFLETVEEARLQRLKTLVEKFEQLQMDQMLKRMEIANVTQSTATALDVQTEINDFCASRGKQLSTIPPSTSQETPSSSPSSSNRARPQSTTVSSMSSNPSMKSVFSIRRKAKHADSAPAQQNSFTMIDEEPEHEQDQSHSTPPMSRGSPESTRQASHASGQQNPPLERERSKQSLTSWFEVNNTNGSSGQPSVSTLTQQAQSPQVDEEGFSVPPPDPHRGLYSSSGALFTQEPEELDGDSHSSTTGHRFKVDIQNQPVHHEEDNRVATEIMTRMASLLREKNQSISRRPRGRREHLRSSQAEPNKLFLSSSPSATPFDSSEAIHSGSNVSASTAESTRTNPFHQSSLEVSTPTSANSVSSSASRSPSLATDIPWQLRPIPEVTQPQAYASIIETLDKKDNDVFYVTGVIKLAYNGSSTPMSPLLIRIQNYDTIKDLQPNRDCVEPLNDEKDVFALKAEAFDGTRGTAMECFTYHLEITGDGNDILPVHASPLWKCAENASYLMLRYQVTDMFDACKGHVALSVPYDQVPVEAVQSSPQGLWDTTKKRLTWTHEALSEHRQTTSTADVKGWPRLLAKFLTTGVGQAQPVMLKYFCKDTLASTIAVEAVPAFDCQLEVKQIHKALKSGTILFS